MRDIDAIVAGITEEVPGVQWERLKVRHVGADDDALWFFCLPGGDRTVQIESATGNCPFLIESTSTAERFEGSTAGATVRKVAELLGVQPGGTR
jgi:hypothetical protein